MEQTLEAEVARLDRSLIEAEKQAVALLGKVRGLRKKANEGDLGALAGLFEPINEQSLGLASSVEAVRDSLSYDTSAALSDGSYVAELKAEAEAQGLVLHEAEGRLTAFPLLLKLEPKLGGVRVGRKLERGLRPSRMVKLLMKAQVTSRFDAARFLRQLFKGYERLAPLEQPGWRATSAGAGPVVPLNDVYDVLTLHPAAAAEYSREAFACDLLRLDSAPDTTTGAGHRFTLPASTGSKGRQRLTVFDSSGAERVFVGIRFSLDAKGGHGA